MTHKTHSYCLKVLNNGFLLRYAFTSNDAALLLSPQVMFP